MNDNQTVPANPGFLCTCSKNSTSAVQHRPSGFQRGESSVSIDIRNTE